MREIWRRERVNIALAFVLAVAMLTGVGRWAYNTASIHKEETEVTRRETHLVAAIKGAVVNPGLYGYYPGDTVGELMIMAGGFAEGADSEGLDLTMELGPENNEIYVPYRGDIVPPEKAPSLGDIKLPLNINTATAAEFQALPGIGPEMAQRIVGYRDRNGPYEKVSDLLNVKGIGEKTLNELFGLITVGDELPWE